MKVLIVFAHPDKRSFNYSLMQAAIQRLEENGDEVKVSDLYRMNWKPIIDEGDFLNHENGTRLKVAASSASAYTEKQLTEDVVAEQEKLAWADTVILQFPLWWFSMPAILKGWVDRVFSCGFAYGVGRHDDTHYGDRYGEGAMEGKRAFCIVTAGGSNDHYSPRGINGFIDDVLFTINHGVLFYPGFTVLPPLVTYRTDSRREEVFENAKKAVIERMDNLANIEPIQYRRQNFGDYNIPEMTLKEGLEKSDQTHFDIHIKKD